MAACSDPTYEPGPVALLDESALEGPLEPPTLTPIAQAFADKTGPFLATLDAAYAALAVEQGLDLAGLLGDSSSNALASAGFAATSAAAPPVITRQSAGTSADAYNSSLTVVVTDAATGAVIPGASLYVLQTVGAVSAPLTDSQGAVVVRPIWGSVTVFVAAVGWQQQSFALVITGDTRVDVALVPGGATAGADVADADAMAAQARGALLQLHQDMRRLWTFVGSNPAP
jgi:hypothetical protein